LGPSREAYNLIRGMEAGEGSRRYRAQKKLVGMGGVSRKRKYQKMGIITEGTDGEGRGEKEGNILGGVVSSLATYIQKG